MLGRAKERSGGAESRARRSHRINSNTCKGQCQYNYDAIVVLE
jgi:hypothetical protein